MKLLTNYKYLFFIFCLFIFIYSPPLVFIPLGTIKWLSLFSIAGLLLYFKKLLFSVLKYKYVVAALILLSLAIFYAFIQDYIIYSDVSFGQSNFYRQTLVVVEVLPIALFLSFYAKKVLNFSVEDVLQSYLVVGFIQSLFCSVMFVSPGIKQSIIKYVLEEQADTEKLLETGFYGNFRGFGIGIDYLFSMPVFQGIAVAIVFLLCMINFRKYCYTLLSVPFLLLSIILNARIGLVPILLFFAVAAIAYLKNLRISVIAQFVLISCVLIFAGYLFLNTAYNSSELENNIDWLVRSYTQNKEFLEGNGDRGTLAILFDSHIHFPQGFSNNFFGQGSYIFGEAANNGSTRSDIGYIINLYFGGLIYCGLLYSSFLTLGWGGLRLQKNLTMRISIYFLLTVIFVVHIKGDVFWSNPTYRATCTIALFPVVERYITRQEQKRIRQMHQKMSYMLQTSQQRKVIK